MMTLTRDDLLALLAAEEALIPHLPNEGLPAAARLFELFSDAHRLVFEQRRTTEADPDAEPWGLAPGRRRGDDSSGPTVEVPSHATAIRARAEAPADLSPGEIKLCLQALTSEILQSSHLLGGERTVAAIWPTAKLLGLITPT